MTDAPQDFSPQQVAALKLAEEWWAEGDKSPQVFRLFGYAGTGKTTLALAIKRKIVRLVQAKDHGANHADTVLSAAFTGKAALVMQSKGLKGSSTIHSLIYSNDDPEGGAMPTFSLNPGSKLADAKLCIIDECSMVSEELGRDLLSFGVKILVLGDPAQLPPVDGAGFFTNATPDVMLSEVHRQAEGNPIIRLSMDVRNGVKLEYGDHGACNVIPWKPGVLTSQNILAADQLLVGRNVTRERMNARYRVLANFKATLPMVGDKLCCLKNNRGKNLFNGGLWKVVKVKKQKPVGIEMLVEPDDAGEMSRSVDIKVRPECFTDMEAFKALPWEERKGTQEFTYGWALTVHKAQGSQWNNVILFNEAGVFGQDATRWLYTGVTRAAETLTVVM
jgi:exodeoxyribonuclease-5